MWGIALQAQRGPAETAKTKSPALRKGESLYVHPRYYPTEFTGRCRTVVGHDGMEDKSWDQPAKTERAREFSRILDHEPAPGAAVRGPGGPANIWPVAGGCRAAAAKLKW